MIHIARGEGYCCSLKVVWYFIQTVILTRSKNEGGWRVSWLFVEDRRQFTLVRENSTVWSHQRALDDFINLIAVITAGVAETSKMGCHTRMHKFVEIQRPYNYKTVSLWVIDGKMAFVPNKYICHTLHTKNSYLGPDYRYAEQN